MRDSDGSLDVFGLQKLQRIVLGKSEYRPVMCPVVLGSGRPLFLDKVDQFGLKLVETKIFDRGAVQLK